MLTVQRQRVPAPPIPWRWVSLLALLVFALVLTALLAGSSRRLPAPFGLAGNGLIVFSAGGDIHTVDPGTGTQRRVVSSPDDEDLPRYSLDGTKLAFVRRTGESAWVVIADADGRREVTSNAEPFNVDPDGIAWAPDGGSIAIAGDRDGISAIFIVDAATGDVTELDVDYAGIEVYWRPPDGRQLAFRGTSASGRMSLNLVTLATGQVATIATDDRALDVRPLGWTPDGRRFAYQLEDGLATFGTILVDIDTGEASVVPVAYGRVSNDGRQVAGLDVSGRVCVASVAGGPCRPIGDHDMAYVGSTRESVFWSPDDRWLVVHPARGGPPVLLDPASSRILQVPWLQRGADSWQRVAP